MHHAVLHRRKFPLNAVVYPVGDGVGLYQGQISIRGELYIHIDAGTELPGLQQVQPLHSLLAENDVCHLLFQTGGGCVVGELTYRIPEEHPVVRRFLRACGRLGLPGDTTVTLGGSDNNILLLHGLTGIVLSCGMRGVHSTAEYTCAEDLLKGAELLLVPNACPMEINRLSQLRGRAFTHATSL